MSATHADELKKTYADIAEGFSRTHGRDVNETFLRRFISTIPKGARILDLGGAIGRDSEWFFNQGFEVTLLDLSADLLAIAKKRIPTVSIVQADATEMEFPDNYFAGVWCNAVLLHLTPKEIHTVCATVHTILQPGGVFFCSLKEGSGEKIVAGDKYGKPMQRYFSFHTKKDVEGYLQKAGFRKYQVDEEFSDGQRWVQAFAYKA